MNSKKENYKDDKPPKIFYGKETQKELAKKFKEFVLEKYAKEDCVQQIISIGGVSKGTIGIYSERYHERHGSDVDLIIVVDSESNIPKDWKKGAEWPRADFYLLATLDHLVPAAKYFDFKPIHVIQAKVFIQGKHNEKEMREYPPLKLGICEEWYRKKDLDEKAILF